jgi:hypothetical protein
MKKKKFRRKHSTQLIKSKASYYVDELAFTLKVHPNTIGKMLQDGLSIIENSYPYLIFGQDAIDFINEQQSQRKFGKLAIDKFICFSCKEQADPLDKLVILEIKSLKTGNLKATCNHCKKTKLNKNVSLQKLPEIMNVLKIQKLLNPLLIQGFVNSGICETKNGENNDKI